MAVKYTCDRCGRPCCHVPPAVLYAGILIEFKATHHPGRGADVNPKGYQEAHLCLDCCKDFVKEGKADA